MLRIYRQVTSISRTDALALAFLAFAFEAEVRGRPWQVSVAALALMLVAAVLPMLRKLRIETPAGSAEAEPVQLREPIRVRDRRLSEPRPALAEDDDLE
jgi:hypothetical protein